MADRFFRGEKLIDREKEINFLVDWFNALPKEILWIYGPKSSGKTTIVEYVVEKELFEDFDQLKPKKNYWVKYMNLRGYLITNYNSFLEAFIKPTDKKIKEKKKINARMSVGIFEIEAEILKEIKNREKDLFNVMIGEISKLAKHKRVIIIIDEIQTLEDIYINGEKELLKEFLNFCVRLTKELHISHVAIISSNTVFIDKIYNDAKLKLTSEFYKVDHLPFEIVYDWLTSEGFKKNDIDMIYYYLGGCIPLLQKLKRNIGEFKNLKEYLEHQQWLAYTEIMHFMNFSGKVSKEDRKIFEDIASSIVKNGYFIPDSDKYTRVIDTFASAEILFFDPLSLKVVGNNRLYEKAMELLVKG